MDIIIRIGDGFMFVAWALTIAYIVMSILPLPYNRTTVAIRGFLEQTVGPVLRFVRRFVPPLGPIDLSPMIALIGLSLVWSGVLKPLLGG